MRTSHKAKMGLLKPFQTVEKVGLTQAKKDNKETIIISFIG